MTWWMILGGLAIFAGLFYGASRLMSWTNLIGVVVSIIKAILPVIMKRKSPEEEAKDREKWRQGIPPGGSSRHDR